MPSRSHGPSGGLRLERLHEQTHGQKVCRPAWTKTAGDERPVHDTGSFAPVERADAAALKKNARGALGKAKNRRTGPMQKVGVFKRRDQRETGLHASRFGVTGRNQGGLF